MSAMNKLQKLRLAINENLRIQRGGAEAIPYIDVSTAVGDITSRQNHSVFGRRGCGKTLLLKHSGRKLNDSTKPVYLNCEDFKKHSYPNVLIEILDALFAELEQHLSGWFGRKKKSRELIASIRSQLKRLREKADELEHNIREAETTDAGRQIGGETAMKGGMLTGGIKGRASESWKLETEKTYQLSEHKIQELDNWLPQLKQQIREFFDASTAVKTVFLQVDDFYHLKRSDQPLVMDYLHRL